MPEASVRFQLLDVVRGAAIVLMVLDHVLVAAWSPPGQLVRETVTRAALPLFCGVSGWLWAHRGPWGSTRRDWQLIAAAGLALVAEGVVGLGFPGILAVFVLLLPARGFIDRWPLQAAALGMVAAASWQLPAWWTGYHPGHVAGLLALGVLAYRVGWRPVGQGPGWLATVGRWPLTFYVAHVWLLAVVLSW